MKTPKYTDLDRYPNGWKPAAQTNISETFARVIREREEAEKKRKEAEALQSRILKWRGNGSR